MRHCTAKNKGMGHIHCIPGAGSSLSAPVSKNPYLHHPLRRLCCSGPLPKENRSMGLDLEKIGPAPDAGFMKLAFTAAERKHMGDDPLKIFRGWTLKEAFLKYIQKGFNESLHQVEIYPDVILYKGIKARVNLFCATLGLDYCISLVTGGKGDSH